MLDLAISIINYKTVDLTTNCLKSIFSKKWQTKFKVFLVDNASNDGSVEILKKQFPQIKVIESNKNLGFAGGHNLVLKKEQARYFLILNSDAEILDKTIDEMVEFIDKNPSVGIAGCRVLGFDNKLQPNGGDLPFGLALLGWLYNLESIGVKTSFHRTDKDYYSKIHEVGWLSGNLMIIRKELIDKIGGLNEDYFMYFEDVEFCYKAKLAGFKVMINPEVTIKHLSGGSLDNPALRQWLGEYKGLLHFYKKQFGNFSYWVIKFLILKTTILRMVAFSLLGRVSVAKNYGQILKSI